ncbi:MAG: right-handed parallel beta-helix repeat-containing protein, partial [Phycisphaerae bacterium]
DRNRRPGADAVSIYWVKDTVAADTIGTVDTFADPYGIQKAFDLATAGDEIRIVVGANNYNSASTSWTNRDAADKTINVDSATPGTATNYVKVSGWTDETTEGQVTLDFDSAVIVGSNGFTVTVSYYVWKNIHVTDCDIDGWDVSAIRHVFYMCKASANGVNGWDTSWGIVWTRCEAANNGGDGIEGSGVFAYCELHDNTALGSGGGGDSNTIVSTIFDGNTGDGASVDDYNMLVGCLFEDNNNGLSISSANVGNSFVNCGFTNSAGYGVANATGYLILEINCGYYGNGTGTVQGTIAVQANRVTTDPTFTDAANRDYSIGTNWKAQGEGGYPSGASTGYVDIGAVQRQETAAGGGGSCHVIGG